MKTILNFLIIAALIMSAAFTSCSWIDAKLPETMTWNDGVHIFSKSFEYDAKNRIVKIYHLTVDGREEVTTITYNGRNLVTLQTVYAEKDTLTVNFSRVKNEITSDNTITVDKNGYIVRQEIVYGGNDADTRHVTTYRNQKGNLTDETNFWFYDGGARQDRNDIFYRYDNMKSPFSKSKTPKWLLQYLLEPFFASKNNVIEFMHTDNAAEKRNTHTHLAYDGFEFDGDGFPVKLMAPTRFSDRATVSITYRGETKETGAISQENATFNIHGTWGYMVTPSEIGEFGDHLPSYSPFMSDAFFHFRGFVYTFRDENSHWNFGQYKEEFTASSTLAPTQAFSYDAENLLNQWYRAGGTREAGWSEGVRGHGIGEHVNMRVKTLTLSKDDLIRFTSLMIVNGYAKNETTWSNNSRVKTLRLYVGDRHWCDLHLADVVNPQIFHFPENLHIYPKKHGKNIPVEGNFKMKAGYENRSGYQLDLRFEIVDVYRGDRFDNTFITGIALDVSR